MSTASRPRATLGTKARAVLGVQDRALKMYTCITANVAMFASPTISMAIFFALLTALEVSQKNATSTKVKGLATLRDTHRDALWTAMEILRAYVQGLADAMSADNAAAVIEAAGLLVAKSMARHKALLTATLTATPGVVHLDAYASLLVGPADATKKVTFLWEMSVDGGTTWSHAAATPYANTDVPGLTLMTTYSFRVAVTIARVTGAWSQPVSLLVH